MVQGKSNHTIANALYISESVVEMHVNAILSKLGLDADDSTISQRVAAHPLRAGSAE